MSSRRVPLLVPITGILLWDWRESYVVLMVLVVPVVLYLHVPAFLPAVLVVLVTVGLGVRLRSIALWWRVLRSGQVVTVDDVEEASTTAGTVRLSHATGWRVHRAWFTGDIVDSVLTYAIGDQQRQFRTRGLPYTSGIVLAHPSRPEALCVNVFPFDVRMRTDDRWAVSSTPAFWVGAAATAALYAALVVGTVFLARAVWF